MEINGPIVLKCADIYLRFPEIMEEEFDDLIEFLNDNNIRCEGATKEHKQLKSTLEEIREYIKHEWFKRGQLGIIDKSFQEWELNNLLQIIDKGVVSEDIRNN